MVRVKSMQALFKRDRRTGDLVFAVLFLVFSALLLSQLGDQVQWNKRGKIFAQPGFWPMVSLVGMTFFALLHLIGSALSPRIYGRLKEIGFWLRSLEYAAWFLAYVWLVPIIGYLPMTVLFIPLLAFRSGYRDKKILLIAAFIGLLIVLIFKTFLEVKIPGGMLYEYLPDAIRSFMLINF
ncbi:tripartite tricarboxylate transporter TctB family protein [Leucothrix mucor]|uniref:tripartite tricarboxylate transporter TctB family protein n=1 Tax=Leucothrix mucor TaxID=45248 RepID=UPI0003B4CBB5|nr:tripartite tricarboxylate transporter TctB family protein [Leucothrix mucor]